MAGRAQSHHSTDAAGQVRLFSFFDELAEPIKKVVQTAWASRGKLAHDIKAYTLFVSGVLLSMPGRAAKVANDPKLHAFLAEAEDPEALAGMVSGLGGMLCLGSVGAVVGVVLGGTTGTALGVVPALFTFGLSLPVGAVAGAAGGLCVGAAAGGAGGFTGGAFSGSVLSHFRGEIRYCLLFVASRVSDAYDVTVVRPVAAVRSTTRSVREKVHGSADYTRAKAVAVTDAVREVAADRGVQVAAASASVGAAALGTTGAAGGGLVGGAAGVLVGLVPALFTFGLSIPVGAVIGGGAGVCVGGAVGTTVGFTGGGASGFLAYKCAGYLRASTAAPEYSAD